MMQNTPKPFGIDGCLGCLRLAPKMVLFGNNRKFRISLL